MKVYQKFAPLIFGSFVFAQIAAQPVAPAVLPATPIQPRRPVGRPITVSHLVTASWYGPGFVGHKTTSGDIFDPKALTGASKTLPIGSVVKVTNPQNGKSVKVKISDRGPFVVGRSLDLSRRAAERIGIVREGVAPVKLTTLSIAGGVSNK
jgi:rare lipoprotein A